MFLKAVGFKITEPKSYLEYLLHALQVDTEARMSKTLPCLSGEDKESNRERKLKAEHARCGDRGQLSRILWFSS